MQGFFTGIKGYFNRERVKEIGDIGTIYSVTNGKVTGENSMTAKMNATNRPNYHISNYPPGVEVEIDDQYYDSTSAALFIFSKPKNKKVSDTNDWVSIQGSQIKEGERSKIIDPIDKKEYIKNENNQEEYIFIPKNGYVKYNILKAGGPSKGDLFYKKIIDYNTNTTTCKAKRYYFDGDKWEEKGEVTYTCNDGVFTNPEQYGVVYVGDQQIRSEVSPMTSGGKRRTKKGKRKNKKSKRRTNKKRTTKKYKTKKRQ